LGPFEVGAGHHNNTVYAQTIVKMSAAGVDEGPAVEVDKAGEAIEPLAQRDSLLQVVDALLAQSYLIFLISDLRLLSATGRVPIKFETLSLDSDYVSKNNAAKLAVLASEIEQIQGASQNEGLSPAQIMAALMVVLRREVQARRRVAPFKGEEEAEEAEKHSIVATITNRKNRKEVEEDMDSLLKAYNYMIGMDLKETGDLPKVKAPLRQRVRASQLPNPVRALKDVELPNPMQALQGNAEKPPSRPKLKQSKFKPRLSVFRGSTYGAENVDEVGDALFKMDTKGGDESLDRNLSEDEILDLMEDAVESREYGKLDFMRDFFREDSVSAVMIQSDARIVWVNDWYPLKVCCSRVWKALLENEEVWWPTCSDTYLFHPFRTLRMQCLSTKQRKKCS